MKTFMQFLKEKTYSEQMDMPPPPQQLSPPAIIKYQKDLGSPTQLGSYLPSMHLDKTNLNDFKSSEDYIKIAKDGKEIENTLKFRTSKEKIKNIRPEVLANSLARTNPDIDQVKKILEYFSEYHDYMTIKDIETIINVVPKEIKSYLKDKLEKERQKHQINRDNFFKKYYPKRIKGLDGDDGYFDSEIGRGGDYQTHYK